MKANFESLSAADADKLFGTTHSLSDATCGRLSISTQFLSKSLELVCVRDSVCISHRATHVGTCHSPLCPPHPSISRRRLMGRPPEPHTAATSAPQPRQETTAAPRVVDDSASPLLSQPPEVLPALAASGAVLLEPARLEEKAVHAGDASGSGASMLGGHKPPQKVWKRTVCLYTYTAASGTYIYVYQCNICCHFVSTSVYMYVCMYVCMPLQLAVSEEVDKAKRRLQEVS